MKNRNKKIQNKDIYSKYPSYKRNAIKLKYSLQRLLTHFLGLPSSKFSLMGRLNIGKGQMKGNKGKLYEN